MLSLKLSLDVLLNNLLSNVFSVANMPIFLVFVFNIAGLIPGSIPIIGISIFFPINQCNLLWLYYMQQL